ncbi:MAG: thioredoxin family protein [Desulfovibrionaceae bacterium]|nr:thioredoxin family protein [Desulfovibrionaceae bacterium]
MEIKVFGPGCARCTETENLVKEMAAAKGGNITVEKVTDLKAMMATGIMSTPAIAIDGVIKSTGRVPTKEEISSWIDGTANVPSTPAASGCGCGCGGKC